MINNYLINPGSIVVVGGSDDLSKPGGKVLRNIITGKFKGDLYVVNPRAESVQGVKSFPSPADIPGAELAIIAIAAKYCVETVEILAVQKSTKAFIILSAGFGEESSEGAAAEKRIAEIVSANGGALIGPNCIGVLTPSYHGVFTEPVPQLDPAGVDFISGSGATAVFIMESAIPNGIRFSSLFSVGNSAQSGVEDVLQYLDETFDPVSSSRIKLLYIESVSKPAMLLKHARSLISKGCHIAAIKAGRSEAGSRAASSHTGAMANPEVAVDALFRKAGIIRCYSRQELAAVASVLTQPLPVGRRLAVVTHAGGPAVMMTDELSSGGSQVPPISGSEADRLLEKLFPGSSVANPIDFLATGTAEQLGEILDSCTTEFKDIDAVAVIFGSPGLFPLDEVYATLSAKMKESPIPVYPVLPSLITAGREVKDFLSKGWVNFPDEVVFARAFNRVMDSVAEKPVVYEESSFTIDIDAIRNLVEGATNGYLDPESVTKLLKMAGIPVVDEVVVSSGEEALAGFERLGENVAMKVIGPIHKSDAGGVILGVNKPDKVAESFRRLMSIEGAEAVLMQQMATGMELFIGAKREEGFGHLVMAGLGGIFVEVLKDVSVGLAPIDKSSAHRMVSTLKGYKMLEGARGTGGVNIQKYCEIIGRVSQLVGAAPEIFEMDINPLLGNKESIVAVDARIRIEKKDGNQ